MKVQAWASYASSMVGQTGQTRCTFSPTMSHTFFTQRQKVEIMTETRTVAVQSKCTYRRDLTTPRFE
eukprot:6276665-Lingulodinium_polyedra.AAC.1